MGPTPPSPPAASRGTRLARAVESLDRCTATILNRAKEKKPELFAVDAPDDEAPSRTKKVAVFVASDTESIYRDGKLDTERSYKNNVAASWATLIAFITPSAEFAAPGLLALGLNDLVPVAIVASGVPFWGVAAWQLGLGFKHRNDADSNISSQSKRAALRLSLQGILNCIPFVPLVPNLMTII
ncbi:MAG: hypothetical protein AAF658_07425, partial [Myxococcota bacterium]